MKRIVIFGIPGSGKSTFANHLSKRLELPVHHLDRHFFIENWVERDYNQFLGYLEKMVGQEEWIIDGNATRSLEIRFKRADVALYFRFNRLLCLWRIFQRLFFKDKEILDRAEGCDENIRPRLIRYLWKFDERVKRSIEELKKKYPHVQFYELRNDKEVQEWVNQTHLKRTV